MKAQFPVIPGDITLIDEQALAYIPKLQQYVPVPIPQLSAIRTVGKCAVSYGVVGARAYIARDLSRAGAIVVVSRGQAQELPNIAARCLVNEVVGGGPAGPFQPCFSKYTIDDVVNGVQDHYYVFVAGTNREWCAYVETFHSSYNPQPL
jgi:hypothetical protein